MSFDALTLKDRQVLVDGIIMEKGCIRGITNGGIVMSKLTEEEVIQFYRLILPNAKLEVYNKITNKYMIDDFKNQSSRSSTPNNYFLDNGSCYRSEWPAKISNCDCGNDQCFIRQDC